MNATLASSSPSPVETEVHRIRALMERRRFAEALAAAETLVVQVPENRDVLYMAAVCLRYLGRIPDALATLERLERLHAPPRSDLHRGPAALGLHADRATSRFPFARRRHARAGRHSQDANPQGIDQWKNYEPWLGELKEALGVPARYCGESA